MRSLLTIILATTLFATSILATPRKLVVVNTLGETVDLVDLADSSVTLHFDDAGLYPNDFLITGETGVLINSGTHDLYFYDMNTLTRIDQLYLGANRNPWSGDFLHPDTLVITNFVSSTIITVDMLSRTKIGEYLVGDAPNTGFPEGILINNRKAYICLTGFNDEFQYFPGKLEIYDLDTKSSITMLDVGLNPQVVQLGYDGYIYVLCTGNYVDIGGWIFKLDPADDTVVDSIDVGGSPSGMTITKQGIAFLAAGGWPRPTSGGERKQTADNVYNRATQVQRTASTDRSGGLIYSVDLNTWSVLHGPSNPINADWGVLYVQTVSDSTFVSCNFSSNTVTELDFGGGLVARYNIGDGPVSVAKFPSCYIEKGDADGNGIIEISDAVHLISYVFVPESPAPVTSGAGDFDCNSIVEITDAVGIVSLVFVPGSPGSCGCAD